MYTDIHHHMLTPGLIDALGDHGVHTVGGEALPDWKPEMSLAVMDRVGIGRTVLSCPIPLHVLGSGAAVSMALRILDAGASGVLMLSNHAGVYQGDAALDPLYHELNLRRAVVFVHPTAEATPIPAIQPSQLEFGFDATRAVANLIINEVPDRFPAIRFVFTHSGSCVPSVAHKLINRKPMVAAYTAYLCEHGQPPPVDELLDQLTSAEDAARRQIARLYFDTALSTAGPTLDALTSLVPTSHILLGTDFPFGQEIGLQYTLRGIERYPGFSDDDRAAVLADNANDLLSPERLATP
jgi:6-methylsalicylate decarboxylase